LRHSLHAGQAPSYSPRFVALGQSLVITWERGTRGLAHLLPAV